MAGRPKTFDPDDALHRAMEVFWRHGYEATSLPMLLDHMGISRQSLYNTFGGKCKLYRQALAHYDQWRFAQVRQILEAPGSPLGNVRTMMQIWGSLASQQPCPGCFSHNTGIELGQHDPEWATSARNHLLTLETLFMEALNRAIAAGELPEDAPVQRHARALIATFQGLLALGKNGMDGAFITDVVEAALAPLEG